MIALSMFRDSSVSSAYCDFAVVLNCVGFIVTECCLFFLQDSPSYINDLVKPVLTCFFDSDSRVRYYGCESLYNIIKVARTAILPFFNDIFDGLSKVRTSSRIF